MLRAVIFIMIFIFCTITVVVFFFRYGRYHTVKQLLDSEKGSFIINETDGEGLTPLHIASQQGKKIYSFIVQKNNKERSIFPEAILCE